MPRAAPRRDTRARATGRLGQVKGARYALLPDELLRSPAVCELSEPSFRVFVAFAAQYHGANNGGLTLPGSVARDFGIRSKAVLVSGTHECIDHGLLELTHQGGLPPLGCSRYGVTWKPIDAHEDLGIERRAASNAWADWKADLEAIKARRKKRHERFNKKKTPARTTDQSRSLAQTSEPEWSPALVSTKDQQAHSLVSTTDPSKILGPGDERGAPRRTRASLPCDSLGSRIRRLADSMPDATDHELARILCVDVDQVRQERRP